MAADSITWKSETPVWVDQWPLSIEKIQAATDLANEQLQLEHIDSFNSPWNTSIFVVLKNQEHGGSYKT